MGGGRWEVGGGRWEVGGGIVWRWTLIKLVGSRPPLKEIGIGANAQNICKRIKIRKRLRIMIRTII